MFVSAVILSVCLFARSFKDAQNLITPLYLLMLFPALFVSAPGIELKGILVFVPILNICLLFKEILLHNFVFESIFLVLLSTTAYALLAIVIFSKLYHAEQILFAEGRGWALTFKRSQIVPVRAFQPSSALLMYAILMLFLFYLGSVVQIRYRHWGILITEWVLIFLPVLLTMWYFKVDVKTALHLKGFRISAFFGSLFLVLGGLGMATWIGLVQVKLFPESVEIGKMIEELINLKSTGLHPVIGLLIVAISPAVCEEVLFRGMLLSSFRRTLSPAWAVVVVALLFGLFHVQVFRIVPTAFIGLYLTYIVYETGSIYLSVIGHALNNGIALMIISYPGLHRYLFWLGEEETMRPAGIGIVLFLAVSGVWLIRHSKRKENRS
jgi:sodium transport system permease protein